MQLYAHPINLEQINKLVRNTPRLSLIPLPSSYKIGFLELKGSVADPVEVALIVASGNQIVDSFHRIVVSPKPRLRNRRNACKHVHGIPSTPNLMGGSKSEVQKYLRTFLATYDVKYVFSTERHIRKLISNQAITTIPFDLLEWQQRGFHYSHQLNYLFKKRIAQNVPIGACSPDNHKEFFLRGVHRDAVMTCRVRHGYQCALADALETYHHWRSPLNTRWIAADFLPTLIRPILPIPDFAPRVSNFATATSSNIPPLPVLRIKLPNQPGESPRVFPVIRVENVMPGPSHATNLLSNDARPIPIAPIIRNSSHQLGPPAKRPKLAADYPRLNQLLEKEETGRMNDSAQVTSSFARVEDLL